MTPLRPRTLAAAALVAATLLAGCSNQTPAALPAPTGTPSATPSGVVETTPSEVPTPSSTVTRDLPLPVMHDLAKEFSQDGATGFAIYYLQVLNYSRNSGDVELLRSISDSECWSCKYDIELINSSREKGWSHDGLETQFRGTWYRYWSPETGEIEMDVTVDRPAHNIVDRSGAVVIEAPEIDEGTFWLSLKWVDDHWIVMEAD